MTIEELTTLENLNKAFYEVAKVSRWKEATQRYQANLLINNIKLQEDLRSGEYKIGDTVDFIINERGKKRFIEAPCVRDRIVQKLLCQEILVPQLRKLLIYDNYASLTERGTSLARKRIKILLRKYMNKYGEEGYILQLDIKKYFENINHNILKQMLHNKLYESKEIMNLIDYIIDTNNNKGLNLGSEVPQILAVFYLSKIDNYIKSVCGVKYYGRYMDDIYIIDKNKSKLQYLLKEIDTQLKSLDLEINKKKTHITKLSHGFTYLQIKYNINNNHIYTRLTHKKIVRERKRLKKFKKKYNENKMTGFEILCCYSSWRKSVLIDCNNCYRTIKEMDKLYKSLFPICFTYKKENRDLLINKTLDKEIRKCLIMLLN